MENMGELLKELISETTMYQSYDYKNIVAEMYHKVVLGADDCLNFLEQHSDILDNDIIMVHTENCSCARHFEQHPIIIDDLEEDCMDRILKQIRRGQCRCLNDIGDGNGDAGLNIAVKEARKSLLHAAAAAGQGQIVEYLLSKGCCVNKVTGIFLYTPLFLAVSTNKTEVVTILLANEKINVNLCSQEEKLTPLLLAMMTGKMDFVDQLLASPSLDLEVCNFRHESPVIVAARMGHDKLMEKILNAGCNPDARDLHGVTALMFAVSYGEKKITKLLLLHKANIHLRNDRGETSLIMAVNSSNFTVAEILLEAGADPNDVSDDGFPALIIAVYSNLSIMVKLLLNYGADVHRTNQQGYSAIHVAAWNGYLNIVNILINAGAHVDLRTNDRNTPLSLAAHGNHEKVVELLLQQGCNVNNADKDLDTPLLYAAFNGNLDCVQNLLAHGADPQLPNRLNTTPLWNAVYRQHPTVVKALLKRNVILNVATVGIEQHAQTDGVMQVFDAPRSPLWVAASHGNTDLVNLLIAAGYDVTGESWIGSGDFPNKCLESETLKKILIFHHRNPQPLLILCRNYFRQLAGRDVEDFVQQLEIPEVLKNFITLKDILE